MDGRVLLVTPYSPLVNHAHAAQDIAGPLTAELAKRVDLHVYAADGHVSGVHTVEGEKVTFHRAAELTALPSKWHRFSTVPYRLRSHWQAVHDAELLQLVKRLRPIHVHGEYFHPAAPMVQLAGVPRSATLHDVEELVTRQASAAPTSMARVVLQHYDRWVVARLERRYIRSMDQVFVFSGRDAAHVRTLNPSVEQVRLGVSRSAVAWSPQDENTLLFAGAMWRGANIATAEFLAREVMPLVWARHATARLKIVGAGATENVASLSIPGRVDVMGEVSDLDDEFARATVNLAPSLAPAGVLLKALRAMAVGCPVVLNDNSAQALDEARAGTNCLIASEPESLADSIVSLLKNPELRSRIGFAGKEMVLQSFNWAHLGDQYVSAFERIAESRRANTARESS